MVNHFFSQIIRTINFARYRFRYLINYIIIGFLSIVIEVLVINIIKPLQLNTFLILIMGFLIGMLFSFILNAKINFKVPKSKNTKTFMFFLTISTIAFILNLILINLLENVLPINYISLRFVTAATIFLISYTSHRKITFNFVKKVGVAVYLNKGESVSNIYSKIKYYSDFIHVDMVDKTFSKNASEIDPNILAEINKTWILEKNLHIMSKTPQKWIKQLHKGVDALLFHIDIDEDIEETINLCKRLNKQVGLVLSAENSIEDIKKYLPRLDFVQVMGIKNLGKSGEPFYIKSLEKVEQLNKLKKKYNFEIIFDGSVKATNVWKINAKYIVSSSGILSTKNPIKSFMELKTNSRYTSVDKKLKRDIFLGMKKIIEEMEFVKSGTVVGSFSEGKGLKGINDIDIVLILDKLSKKNFQITLSKFEKLKTDIESKYGWPVIINNTLGPLKFNEKTIVFHLMLYDEKTHKEHCLKSPFTCFDWQNSKYFFKKPMSEICKIYDLQLKDFFNSRRSAKEYLKNLKEGKIPYRIYDVQKNNVMEIQKYKEMNSRDRIEFSYHIMKFLILNFLKLYYNKNIKSSFNNCVEKFFEIFPENKKEHTKTLNKLFRLKNSKQYKEFDDYTKVENFVIDFEKQFKQLFEIK